jgi:hypothetical protein
MKAITKALVVAMLVFITLVPAMAFVPTIPATVEKTGIGLTGDDAQITSDTASYLYTRTVVDAQGNFQPQAAYSAVEFGANQETTEADGNAVSGEIANAIGTAATFPTGTTGITRQFIAQSGTASVSTAPASPADAENVVDTPVVTASLSSSNLAWISGDLNSFTVSPSTFGTVGGNYLDPAEGTVSGCGNIWLYENDPTETISVTANTDTTKGPVSTLVDAYAGTATSTSLKAYPSELTGSLNIPAEVTMSGYAEKFGGYDNADVGGYIPASALGGSININFGAGTVTQGWDSHGGEGYTWPVTGTLGVPNI